MSHNITYDEAWAQLQKILRDLEQGNVSMDKLDLVLEESKRLVQLCESKLKKVEDKLNNDMPNDSEHHL